MKFKIEHLLPGTNLDGTAWKKTDWIGWFVTTCVIGAISMYLFGMAGII